MTLRQIMQCAQPIFFEDGVEGFEYSYGGTFFFATFRGTYFAITAKHCLRNRDCATIRLLRPTATKEKTFIPLSKVTVIEDPPDRSCDWSDLMFITLNGDLISASDKIAPWFLDFNLLSKLKTNFVIGDGLGTKGYPDYGQGIDYETGIIKIGGVAWSGLYGGAGNEPHIHKLKFSDLEGIADLSGFSGAPVFKIFQNNRGTQYWFAGVILRGTLSSKTAHFVDHEVVFGALELICQTTNRWGK